MDSHAADSSRTPPSHFGRSASPSFAESTTSLRQSRSWSRTPSISPHTHPHPHPHPRARARSRSPRERRLNPTSERSKTAIYVENLSHNIQPSHLKHIFGWYGHVISIHLSPCNQLEQAKQGRKNWAYVQMSNVQDATKGVLHMSGGQIDGLTVQVQCCVWPKDLQASKDETREREREREGRRWSRYETGRDECRKSWSLNQNQHRKPETCMPSESRKRIISGSNNNNGRNNDDRKVTSKPMRKWGAPTHT